MKPLLLALLISISALSLFADADLSVTVEPSTTTTIVAGVRRSVFFTVRNNGPDTARDVVLMATASSGDVIGACATGCPLNDGTLQVGSKFVSIEVLFPDTPGDVAVTASVTSSTPDPNTANNSAAVTVHLSPNPDVLVSLAAPFKTDLSLPFPLTINTYNLSAVFAHDVDTTVEFRPDVAVKTLPFGCSNPAAGRVVCHSDVMSQGGVPAFVVTLFAPPSLGTGRIDFTATTTEREPDFDPSSNTAHASTNLNPTLYVTTTADSGAGSLRQAILDANAAAIAPTIAFRIAEPSQTPWKTIRVTSPLPAVTARGVRIDGGTQAGFFGDANPDGPEIQISGGGTVDGDGILIQSCSAELANLAIGGFLRNGVSVLWSPELPKCPGLPGTQLHHLFVGTDPTGTKAHPNSRGIGTSVPNGNDFNSTGGATDIHDCVISGNTFSGIFGLSGRLNISSNRIGVEAHRDAPLPNGNSGVFIGPGGFGSDVGPGIFTGSSDPAFGGNVIAFNGETGVAVASGVHDVGIRNNRIWSNRLLGIDIGLDGPTASVRGDFNATITSPVLTSAHYDPISGKTMIDGDVDTSGNGVTNFTIDLYASDAADPTGFGEGQRPLGKTTVFSPAQHFHFEAEGNLTGQWITATNTRSNYIGFAKPAPEGIEQGFLTQTSEFSRGIPVQ